MSKLAPALTISVGSPDTNERIPLTLSLSPEGGEGEQCTLELPFPLARIPLLLRALSARQNPYYPTNDKMFRSADEREQAANHLRNLQLWDDNAGPSGAVVSDVHMRVGQILGAAILAAGTMRSSLSTLYDAAIAAGEGEVVLHFEPNATSLAALPWELAYDGPRPILLARGTHLACTRILAFGHALAQQHNDGQERHILTVAPHAYMDDAARAFEQNARMRLREAVRERPVVVESLNPATMEALSTRLEKQPRIDVLDYFGHGRLTNAGGALLFDSPQGGPHPALASQLAALPALPLLVVLHACHSAQVDIDEPLATVAVALSEAGVRAVIAMQVTIQMSAATNYVVPTLYQALADGRSVQQAVTDVRRSLFTAEPGGTSWYVPALYLRQPDRQPCVPLPKRTAAAPNPFAGLGALEDSSQLVGRKPEQLRLWERLQAGGHLSIVGPAGSGKSAMLALIDARRESLLTRKGAKLVWLRFHPRMNLVGAQFTLATALGGKKVTDLTRFLYDRHLFLILLLDDLHLLDKGSIGLDVRIWLRGIATPSAGAKVQLVATSTEPLSRVFEQDDPVIASPLAGTLSDAITLGPLAKDEAREYIRSRLENTPLLSSQFESLLTQPLYPGPLQTACRIHYDSLCEAQ